MKRVRVLKEFNYQGVDVFPGDVITLPDLTATSLRLSGDIEILMIPANRIEK